MINGNKITELTLDLAGKERMILAILYNGKELYGLEMVRMSGGELKRGTIYVTLARMVEKGLVESRQEDKPADRPGLPRRLYKITGYGRRAYGELEKRLASLRGELLPQLG